MGVIDGLKADGCKKVDSIDFHGVNFDVWEGKTSFYLIYEFGGFSEDVIRILRYDVYDLNAAKNIFLYALIYMFDYNKDYMHFDWLNMLGGYIITKYIIDKLDSRFRCMNALRQYNQFEIVEGEELDSVISRLPDGALDSFHAPKVYRCFDGEEWNYMVMNGYTWID